MAWVKKIKDEKERKNRERKQGRAAQKVPGNADIVNGPSLEGPYTEPRRCGFLLLK